MAILLDGLNGFSLEGDYTSPWFGYITKVGAIEAPTLARYRPGLGSETETLSLNIEGRGVRVKTGQESPAPLAQIHLPTLHRIPAFVWPVVAADIARPIRFWT